jgi:hypothetical protein
MVDNLCSLTPSPSPKERGVNQPHPYLGSLALIAVTSKIKERFSVGRRRVTPKSSAKQRAAGVAMKNPDVDFKLQLSEA